VKWLTFRDIPERWPAVGAYAVAAYDASNEPPRPSVQTDLMDVAGEVITAKWVAILVVGRSPQPIRSANSTMIPSGPRT
jgi:hypothetical protein